MTSPKMDLVAVSYTNLPGGTYTFHLDLEDGEDNSPGVSVTVIKEKAFYERPEFWAAVVVAALLMIAGIVRLMLRQQARTLERKAAEEARQKEEERIGRELNTAASIQAGALPSIFPAFPDRKEFDIYATMDPAKAVGGDFYDFFMVDNDHVALVMADVSGKGVPAALFMMAAKILVQNHTMNGGSPAEVLQKVNNQICQNNKEQMFVTVWLGILDTSTGKLVAANAGHEYPIVKDPEGTFEILKDKHDFVLGGMEDIVYHEYELQLSPGSKIFLYTDGIPEATDGKKKMFGMERLLKALNKEPEKDPQELMVNVRKAVDSFVKDAEQFDDLTMMCLEYKGKEK